MGKITLSGAIPGEATNGLGDHAKGFIEQPLKLVPVVAMVAVSKIVTKTETDETYPTLKVHHWEVVPEKHRKAFGKILGDALGARTGAQELPFPDGGEVPLRDADSNPFPEADDPDGDGD